jgi:hypothetical protein
MRQVEGWKQNELMKLKTKQEDTLILIKDKAERNQSELRPRLHILRALYGKKAEI